MVVVWDVLPLVPLMVMVRVPVEARLLAVIFRVEVPAPLIDVGVKVRVVRLPCPLADRLMAELNPPVTAVVTVTVPDVPRATVMEVGEALIEKPAATEVTVSETVVVFTVVPEVPETVML